jgi:hypothetical protein
VHTLTLRMERVSFDIGIPLGSGTLTLVGWMQAGNCCLKGSEADGYCGGDCDRKVAIRP